PVLEGKLAIKDFEFGGFPLGDIEQANTKFRPLVVELTGVRGRKGKSQFDVPSARLDFDTEATVVVDAQVASKDLDVRDFFSMWHFDRDPRFEAINGHGALQAGVHFVYGGKADRCGGGYLQVRGDGRLKDLDLYGEKYEQGT